MPLAVTCPKCGASNQPEDKFCGDCATPLAAAASREILERLGARPFVELIDRKLARSGAPKVPEPAEPAALPDSRVDAAAARP